MKLFHLFIIACAFQCSFGQAAVFTSTATLNQNYQTSFRPRTILEHPSLNDSSSRLYNMSITSGVNSAAFSTDTDADNGYIADMQFKPIGLPGPATFSRSLSYQRLVVDVPANFPIPPVTHVENSVFQERIQFGVPSIVTPTLANSTVNSLVPIQYGSPWFAMDNELTLAPISFVLQGTYEAIGPTTTKSIPFSVTYEATDGLTVMQRTGVEGGASFGNGFQAKIRRNMDLRFRTTSTTVIDDEVDGLRFRLIFPDTAIPLLRGVPIIPEPSSIALLAITVLALVARSRHRE